MSRSVEDDWVLDEGEALLDMDGRRERLELVVAGLQSGEIQPVDPATARPDREAPPGPPHPMARASRPQLKLPDAPRIGAHGDLNVPLCLRVMALAVTAWRSAGQVSRRAGSRSGPEPARMLTVIGRRHFGGALAP